MMGAPYTPHHTTQHYCSTRREESLLFWSPFLLLSPPSGAKELFSPHSHTKSLHAYNKPRTDACCHLDGVCVVRGLALWIQQASEESERSELLLQCTLVVRCSTRMHTHFKAGRDWAKGKRQAAGWLPLKKLHGTVAAARTEPSGDPGTSRKRRGWRSGFGACCHPWIEYVG